MRALILDAENHTANVEEVAKPTPAAHEILVEVKAISLNPVDPLYVQHPLAKSGRTVGSDFAGIVVSLGSSVPHSSRLNVGTRVAGFLQGACSVNERPGAFAEYLVIDWDLVWKVPQNVTLESAAGVSLVALTAAQGVWYRLGLDTPFSYDEKMVRQEHPEWAKNLSQHLLEPEYFYFFIYGASTSVGLYAAQLVQLSAHVNGKTIGLLGAASRARWDMLKRAPYQYESLVDYRDSDWPQQIQLIKQMLQGKVHYAYDCISEGDSVQNVASSLSSNGRMAIVRSRAGGAWKADDLPVEPIYGAVWEGLGEEVQYQGFTVERSVSARAFAVKFYEFLSQAVGSELMPVPIRLMPGGLDKVVEDGFVLLGPGTMESRKTARTEEWMKPVSAEKLVYTL
jgi:NADPH:quinone reductase-like Zn-dependent oxidoreductase